MIGGFRPENFNLLGGFEVFTFMLDMEACIRVGYLFILVLDTFAVVLQYLYSCRLDWLESLTFLVCELSDYG